MTKVIILGEQEQPKGEKPIELLHVLVTHDIDTVEKIVFEAATSVAKDWGNIYLLRRNYFNGLDLMYCDTHIQDPSNERVRGVFLGHFNDGVV